MRLSGEGEAGLWGGPPGNLYIRLSVREHQSFKREGDDILYELPVNFAQAALGDEVEIPTLEGQSSIKIPTGTQTGKVIRLKEKGVPHLRRNGRGDLLVNVKVVTPHSLNEEQRRLFEELAKTWDAGEVSKEDKSFFQRVKNAFGG